MIYTFDLSNKIILVTGGYGYLGKAISESLAYHGAEVFVLGRDEEKFKKAFDFDEPYASNLHFEFCDTSDSESIKGAFKSIHSKYRKIDAVINNAFYSRGQSPENMADEDWAYGIEGTLNSVFWCIREIIPYFKAQSAGKIINVSSMYGVVAPQFEVYDDYPQFLNPPHYGAAKAGIIQLTKYYASYLGRYGVTVNSITPGPFPSMNTEETKGFISNLAHKTCLNRIGEPNDLAGAFVFLASNASNYITGQNIIVDGGWTIK